VNKVKEDGQKDPNGVCQRERKNNKLVTMWSRRAGLVQIACLFDLVSLS
jgi:hypothetical protein